MTKQTVKDLGAKRDAKGGAVAAYTPPTLKMYGSKATSASTYRQTDDPNRIARG